MTGVVDLPAAEAGGADGSALRNHNPRHSVLSLDAGRGHTAAVPKPPDDVAGGGETARRERRRQVDAASARISADVEGTRGARELSGRLGIATVDIVLPRAIDDIWTLVAALDTSIAGWPAVRALGSHFTIKNDDEPEPANDLQESGDPQDSIDHVACRLTEKDEPTRLAMTWNWMRSVPPDGALAPWLPVEAMMTVTLTDLTTDPEQPQVRIELLHTDIPVEWVDEIADVWRVKMEEWAEEPGAE